MSGRLTMVGLAVLCALAFGAFGVSAASATESTAFTCVKGGSGGTGIKFSDPDCKIESATGEFGHVAIPNGESTQLTAKALNSLVLQQFEAEEVKEELLLAGAECSGCMFENVSTAGEMGISGSGGKLKFTGVIYKGQEAKCMIKSVPGGVAETIESEPLLFSTEGTYGLKILPLSGTSLAHFEIVSKPGQSCFRAGPYNLTGDLLGLSKGAVSVIDATRASKTIALNGRLTSLRGELTLEAGPTGGEHHPVALT